MLIPTSVPGSPASGIGLGGLRFAAGDLPPRPVTDVQHVQQVAAVYGWQLPVPWEDTGSGETAEIRAAYGPMMADDSVKSAVWNKVNSVASLDFQVIPEDYTNPREVEAADCLDWALRRSRGGVPAIVRKILAGGLKDGYSVCDPVFPLAPEGDGRWAGYKPLKTVKHKDPDSYTLRVDQYREPRWVVSTLDPSHAWPIETFLYFTNDALYENPFGTSDLRAAYRFWLMKDAVWKARGLYTLMLNGGLLVGTWDGSSDRKKFEQALQAARGAGWIVVPPGCTINLVALGAGSDEAFAKMIADLDQKIVTAIQGAYLHMLEGQTPGGRGASFVHGQTADAMKLMLAAGASAVVTCDLLPQIMRRNYRGVACPFFCLQDPDTADLKQQLDVDVALLQQVGLQMSRSYFTRKYRRPPPKDQADTVQPPPLPGQYPAGEGDAGGGGSPKPPPPDGSDGNPTPGGNQPPGSGGGPTPQPDGGGATVYSFAELATEVERFCGGRGSKRPGPCPDPNRPHSRYRARGGRTASGEHKEGSNSPVLPRHAGTGKAVPTAQKTAPVPKARASAARVVKKNVSAGGPADGTDAMLPQSDHPMAKAIRADKESKAVADRMAQMHDKSEALRKAAADSYHAQDQFATEFAKHREQYPKGPRGGMNKKDPGFKEWKQERDRMEKKLKDLKATNESAVKEYGVHRQSIRSEFIKSMGVTDGQQFPHQPAAPRPDAPLLKNRPGLSPIKNYNDVQAHSLAEGTAFAGAITPSYGDQSKGAFDVIQHDNRAFMSMPGVHHGPDVSPRHVMAVTAWENTSTVVHELGHKIEADMPGAKAAANEFLKYRVGDEKPVNLKGKFGGGYEDWEMGRKDRFDAAFGDKNAYYAGKTVNAPDPSGVGYTEIVSMGMERMFSDPADFAAKDPEYFRFVVGLLKGKHRS